MALPRRARLTLIAPFATVAPDTSRALEDVVSLGGVSLNIGGYIEGRFIAGGGTRSWEDSGLGKVRYGADADGKTRMLERTDLGLAARAAETQAQISYRFFF